MTLPELSAAATQGEWEYFRDPSYFDMWCVRQIGERRFGAGFHVMTCEEARALYDLLNTRTGQLVEREAVAGVVEALESMIHAVCHETGFAAAVRQDSGLAYPWEPLEQAEAQARAALTALKENERA